MIRIPLLLALAVLITACASATAPQVPERSEQLIGIDWTLVEIQSMDDRRYRPAPGQSYRLRFERDGQVHVVADCNRGSGGWQHTPPSGLVLGPVALTQMHCGDDSGVDQRFQTDLAYVRSFVLHEDGLYLATLADGAILVFSNPQLDTAPGFDCADADGRVQRLICADRALAARDRRLDQLYQRALATFPADEIRGLRAFQRGWIKGRDACWKASDLRRCVLERYDARMTELEIATGALEVPAPMRYHCDAGRIITIYLYADAWRPALVLNDGPRQTLLQAPSAATGQRFVGANIEFQLQGDVARYAVFGQQPLDCRRQ